MSDLHALEIAQAFASGRLAAAAHAVICAHDESDETLLTSTVLGRLQAALQAFDDTQKALVDYLAEAKP